MMPSLWPLLMLTIFFNKYCLFVCVCLYSKVVYEDAHRQASPRGEIAATRYVSDRAAKMRLRPGGAYNAPPDPLAGNGGGPPLGRGGERRGGRDGKGRRRAIPERKSWLRPCVCVFVSLPLSLCLSVCLPLSPCLFFCVLVCSSVLSALLTPRHCRCRRLVGLPLATVHFRWLQRGRGTVCYYRDSSLLLTFDIPKGDQVSPFSSVIRLTWRSPLRLSADVCVELYNFVKCPRNYTLGIAAL